MSLISSLPLTKPFKVKLTAATCHIGCVFQIGWLVILLKSLLLLPLRIGSAMVPLMPLAMLARSLHLIWLCQSFYIHLSPFQVKSQCFCVQHCWPDRYPDRYPFIRSLGDPCSQYLDDWHVGLLHLRLRANCICAFSNFNFAPTAAFIACSIIISLGYHDFIGLKESCLISLTARCFLGYICDSDSQAFLLPRDKKR